MDYLWPLFDTGDALTVEVKTLVPDFSVHGVEQIAIVVQDLGPFLDGSRSHENTFLTLDHAMILFHYHAYLKLTFCVIFFTF